MKNGFAKIACCTPSVAVADTQYNAERIKEQILFAVKKDAEVIVFPELSISSSTCGDLYYSQTLLSGCEQALIDLARFTEGVNALVVVGLPYAVNGTLFNVGAVLFDGKVLALIPKRNIVDSDAQYESRYFSSYDGENIQVKVNGEDVLFGNGIIFTDDENPNLRVAVEIGSDLLAFNPPSNSHVQNGATVVVNLASGSEVVGGEDFRKELIKSHSARLKCAYALSMSGYGESTGDGVCSGDNIVCENGEILAKSVPFENGVIFAEIDCSYLSFKRVKIAKSKFQRYTYIGFNADSQGFVTRKFKKTPFVPTVDDNYKSKIETILKMQAEGLKKRIEHTHSKTVVLGLSGGLDSTLALIACVGAMKSLNRPTKDIIAITMPCFGTTSRTYQNSIKLAKGLGVTLKKIDVTKAVKVHLKDISHSGAPDVTYENAQARERTQVVMDVANMTGGLVIGTGDLSELALGWATYNGDHMSMYAVNASISKTLVRKLVEYYAGVVKGKAKAVLCDILDTPVSPELLPSENDQIAQKTEDIVGPYILHDFFLYHLISRGASPKKLYETACVTFDGDFSAQTIKHWLTVFFKRFFTQQFKRSCVPDGVKVGAVALSPRGDWRMPSDATATLYLKELENL